VSCSDASGQCGDAADAVPAGKRLVIQHLTANGNVPSGAKVSTLAGLIPGTTRRLNLFAQITGPSLVNDTKDQFVGNEVGPLYVEAAQRARVSVQAPGGGVLEATITGYIVELDN